VHDEDVQEGGERSKKDFLMLFFSETGLHLLREATDLFVGSNALLLLVRNLIPPRFWWYNPFIFECGSPSAYILRFFFNDTKKWLYIGPKTIFYCDR
jgi:hypothetical protein